MQREIIYINLDANCVIYRRNWVESDVKRQNKAQKRAHCIEMPMTANEEKVFAILRDMQKDCDPFVSDLAAKSIRIGSSLHY